MHGIAAFKIALHGFDACGEEALAIRQGFASTRIQDEGAFGFDVGENPFLAGGAWLVSGEKQGCTGGALDNMLYKVADVYDEEVSVLVESLVSILEPIMVVVLGLIVGFIVFALFMPLIALLQSLT